MRITPSLHSNAQDENMVSNKDLSEKYKSVEDYEEDFM